MMDLDDVEWYEIYILNNIYVIEFKVFCIDEFRITSLN